MIFGLLVVKNSVECRIARQYLCQTAMFMCGLTMLSLTTIRGNYHAYLLFVWIYGMFKWFISFILSEISSNLIMTGIFLGGYHYSLKMFTFEKVRARNFARAWGFVQFSQVINYWGLKQFFDTFAINFYFYIYSGTSNSIRCSISRLFESQLSWTSWILHVCWLLYSWQSYIVPCWCT